MRSYKKILAGILAVNLAVSSVSMPALRVYAQEADTAQESVVEEPQDDAASTQQHTTETTEATSEYEEPEADSFSGTEEGVLDSANQPEADAQGFTIEDGVLTAYSGTDKNVVIPDGVTEIGIDVFKNNMDIESVTFPDSLKKIGDSAFSGCTNLNCELKFPEFENEEGKIEGLEKIGPSAFDGCSKLTGDLYIPDSVTEIGYAAFRGCKGLDGTLTLSKNLRDIGASVFYGCSGLTGGLYIPDGVVGVGSSAFYGCSGLTGDLYIPNMVGFVGEKTFYGCSGFTGELHISTMLDSIYNDAFHGCGFTGELIIPDNVDQVECSAFSGCKRITSVVIGKNLRVINPSVFENCTGIKSIVYGENVTNIDVNACLGCSGVSEITYWSVTPPEFVSQNGDPVSNYFGSKGMSNLTRINVPARSYEAYSEAYKDLIQSTTQIEPIENDDFIIKNGVLTSYIGDLEEVIIPENVTEIGDSAFKDNSKVKKVTIPEGVTKIGDSAFYNCKSLEKINFPENLLEIGNEAFEYCSSLTGQLSLPDKLKKIGNYAFRSCSGFTGDLNIPDSVTETGEFAFGECTGLNGKLHISTNMTQLNRNVFCYCGFQGEITIPDNIESVSYGAFDSCMDITAIVYGKGVKRISADSNRPCHKIDYLVFQSKEVPEIVGDSENKDENVSRFFGSSSMAYLRTVYVPAESYARYMEEYKLTENVRYVKTIGDQDFVIKDGILTVYAGESKNVTIPEGVTEIGPYAFYQSDIESVEFPSGVKKIGKGAFSYADSLTGTLKLPEGLEKIGEQAFEGCSGLTGNLYIPDTVTTLGSGAFSGCRAMTGELHISEALGEIASRVFMDCQFTGELNIPDNIAKIGEESFRENNFTGEVIIPNKVTEIGRNALPYGKINSIVFGENVEYIGDLYSQSLTTLSFLSQEPPELENINVFFSGMDNLTTIYVPFESYEKYVDAFGSYIGESTSIVDVDFAGSIYNLKSEYTYSKTAKISWEIKQDKNITAYQIYSGDEMILETKNLWAVLPVTEKEVEYKVVGVLETGQKTRPRSITLRKREIFLNEIGTYNPENILTEEDSSLYVTLDNACDVKTEEGKSLTVDFYYYDAAGERQKIGDTIDNYTSKSQDTLTYDTNWDVSGLAEGEYKVEVAVTDPDDTVVTYSRVIAVDNSKPEAISSLVAVGDVNQIVLSWTISHEIDTKQYRIYRRAEDEDAYTLIKRIYDRNTLSYTDTKADDKDKKYYYYVVGVDNAGREGEPSAIACATPGTDKELPRVVKLTPANKSRVAGNVEFYAQSQDNIQATATSIYYSVDGGETWTIIKTEKNDYCRCTLDTTQIEGESLLVKALAEDAAGNASTGLTYTYSVDNVGPEKVKNVSFESTSTTITLRWDDVADQDFSFFRVEEKQGDTFVKLQDVYSTLGVNIYDKKPGRYFIYRVVAYDQLGNRGIESDEITASTKEDVTAPVITFIKPNADYYKDSIDVAITAQDDNAVSSILIQTSNNATVWKDYATKEFTGKNKTETAELTIALSDFEEGALYVRGVATDLFGNTGDDSVDAPYVQYIVDRTAPAVPAGLSVDASTGMIEVSWTMGSEKDIDGYVVYRSTDDANYVVIKENVHTVNYIDRNIEPGITYYYKIAVHDQAGNESELSDRVSAVMQDDVEDPVIQSIAPENGSAVGSSNQTFQVMAQDNWKLNSIQALYAINDSDSYIEFINQTNINNYYKTVAASLPISKCKHGDKIKVKIIVTDAQGLRTVDDTIVYTVDKETPKIKNITATGDTEKITISWNGYGETDLAGYKIYRKSAGNSSYSLIAQRSAKATTSYQYVDYNVDGNETYYYKVEAIDKTGNVSSVISESAWINVNPVLSASFDTDWIQEVNVEYVFDASATVSDLGIQTYEFDFGDGQSVSGTNKKLVHKYTAVGTYDVTLTVTSDAGTTDSVTRKITVEEPKLLGTVKVKLVDSNGNRLSGIPVYYDLDNTSENIKYSGTDGYVTFTGTAGRCAIGTYCDGYLPVKRYVVVAANTTQEISITMVKEPIVTGEFEINRMTLDEIKAAGIDITDPANQQVVRVNLTLAYGKEQVKMNFCTNGNTIFSGGTTIVDTDEGKRKLSVVVVNPGNDTAGIKNNNLGVVAIMDVPVEASYLKEFFEVKLHILNHADGEFKLTNNVVTLNVPKGMTLMDANNSSSQATVNFDELKGQEQKTITWTLRGDDEGEYDLSADYSSILSQFNEPVEATFKTDTPIKVYGKSAMKLIADVNKDIMYGALYFDLSIQNVGGADIYLPTINVMDNAITVYEKNFEQGVEKNVTLLNTSVSNEDGYFRYLGTGGSVDSLAVKEVFTKKYAVYGAVDSNDRLLLLDAIQKSAQEAGIELEIRSVDMDLFDRTNAEKKMNSIFSNPEKTDMYNYLIDKNDEYFYYYMWAKANEDSRGLEIAYDVCNFAFNWDFDIFTHDETEEITRNYMFELLQDESFSNAVDTSIDLKYSKILKQIFDSSTIIFGVSDKKMDFIQNIQKDQKAMYDLAESLKDGNPETFEKKMNKYWEIFAANAGIQVVKIGINKNEFASELFSAVNAQVKYEKDALKRINKLLEVSNTASKMYYQIVYLSSVEEEANKLFDIILAHKEIDEIVYNEVSRMKEKMNAGFADEAELFKQELDKAIAQDVTQTVVTKLEKKFIEIYNLDASVFLIVYKAIKFVFTTLDYTFGWDTHFSNVKKLRVLAQLTTAIRAETMKWQSQSESASDFLTALKYLIKIRLLGEKEFVAAIKAEDERTKFDTDSKKYEAKCLNVISQNMGTLIYNDSLPYCFANLDAWYRYIRDNITGYRDSLFEEQVTYDGIPDAPRVTINYESMSTNEEFTDKYEYSIDGVDWIQGDGKKITIAQGTVGYYLWVRVKATKDNLAGNITKAYVQAKQSTHEELGDKMIAYSISLRGNIAVNFYMTLSDEICNDETAYMRYTLPDGSVKTQKVSEAAKRMYNETECYVFTCEVCAAQMNDGIKAQMIANGKSGEEYTYKVKDYADQIIENKDEEDTFRKAAPMVKAMLNYGAYSQIYFGNNEGNLANAGVEDNVCTANIDTSQVETFVSPKEDIGVRYYASSLILKSETSIRHYFTYDSDSLSLEDIKANYEFRFADSVVMPEIKGGYIIIQKDNIEAANLDTAYQVVVTNKQTGESIEFNYSALQYAKSVLEGTGYKEALVNVVKALWLYNEAANEYYE